MKKPQRTRMRLSGETIRQLNGAELLSANGGMPKISYPTDEMGACSDCGSRLCSVRCTETTPPPVR